MKKISLGVDVGGTKLALALVDESGKVIDRNIVYDHVEKTEADMIEHINILSKDLLRRNNMDIKALEGIGLCFPGHISNKGIVISAANLNGFDNYPLKENMEKCFDTKVIIDNDANCQTYAEYKFGAGKNYDDLIFVTVSTGVGGGIILNNKLYRGATGTAGEFGHAIIAHNSNIDCTCGNKGCWNACSGGMFLNRIAEKFLSKGINSDLITHNDTAEGKVDGRLIKKGLDADDELCKAVVDECADYIAVGLYNIFQVLNPPIVVLGGGLMNLGDTFLILIKEKFKKLSQGMIFDEMRIVRSELADDSGVIGAASLAMDEKT